MLSISSTSVFSEQAHARDRRSLPGFTVNLINYLRALGHCDSCCGNERRCRYARQLFEHTFACVALIWGSPILQQSLSLLIRGEIEKQIRKAREHRYEVASGKIRAQKNTTVDLLRLHR